MRLTHIKEFSPINNGLVIYKCPINFNYFWNFGILAGLALTIQLITGIGLAMHYTPHVDMAFNSVEHIMRDLEYGWLLRYMHSNGASLFFMVVYTHIFRGLYYGSYSYPRQYAWWIGCIIFILMMATAFLGYVLPWGQMSFWGATVITNFFSIIPFFGPDVVSWIWGGYAINNATLNRFFSLHYLLSFLIVAASGLHIIALHVHGSNNPLGVVGSHYSIPFYPYYYVKDLVGINVYLMVFFYFVFFNPEILGHPDNYINANPLVTPAHIVPEWYFLPFYAILRSIPHKTGGIIAMGGAIVMLFLMPFLHTSPIRSSNFRPIYSIFFWIFVVDTFLLGWIGTQPVEAPYVEVGQFLTIYYFVFFLIIVPLSGLLDRFILDKTVKY